ncbi:CHAT domain-containing protein [uncultured Cytophaga sp.]|uniref:CHAT domain-containing protein n=1 Tax=uncultured Cytophaga sp. TaxID=160238 RepID=UPI00261BD897|nr:CHAT domain-containing protein [uncultured Cytophaga sp.]
MNSFLKITLSAFCILLFFYSNAAGDTYESSFEKIELYYEKGDYKLGLRSNDILINSISNDKKSNSLVLSRAYFLKAKGAELDGNFTMYEEFMFKGDRELQKAEKDDLLQYTKAINCAIETYISYGDYVKASNYLNDAYAIIQKGSLKDSSLYYGLKKSSVITFYRQGFYIKAQKNLNEILSFSKRSLVKSEMGVDPKTGKPKVVKVSSKELFLRKRNYARMLNMQAEMYLDNGRYASTDSILTIAQQWIKNNIGDKDVSYVETLLYKGRLAETLGDIKTANKLFDNAYETLLTTKGGRYQNYSREAIRIFEYLIPTYKLVGNGSDYRTKSEMFEVRVNRYYGKDNYYYSKVLFVEIQQNVINQNWTSVAKNINVILEKPNMIPLIHLDRANFLDLLADAYIEMDQYDEAEAALDEATKIKATLLGEDAPNYHMQLLDRATYYVNYTDKFKEAETTYKYSLNEIVSKAIDHQHVKFITYLYQEINLFELTDRFDDAQKVSLEATAIVEKRFGKMSVQYGTALQKQANIDIYKGNYGVADTKLGEALALYVAKATSKDNLEYASVLETQARLYIIEGLYDDAEKNLKMAFKLSKRTLKSSKLSSSIEELAILYIHIGKYQETEETLLKSISLREKRFGVDNRSLINPFNQIGYLYFIKGDYARAEKYANRAMDICKKTFGVNSIRYAESLKLYADIHAAIGDYNNAQVTVITVMNIYRKIYGDNHIQVALVKNDLALIKYYNKGSNTEIEQLFLSALTTIRTELNENTPIYAEVLKNISLFYLETGKIDLADKNLEAANKIWLAKFGATDRHAADYFYLKGLVFYKKQKYTDANTSFLKSKEIYASSFSTTHPDYTKALSKSGQMYFILKDYPNAIRAYDEAIKSYLTFIQVQFPALSEREKMKSWNNIKADFEFYCSMAYQLKDANPELIGNVYDMTIATKALMLNASIKVRQRILNSGNQPLIDAYQSWLGKKEFYSTILSMSNTQIQENGIDKTALQKDIENLEKYLSESSGLFAKSYETKLVFDWKQLKSTLNNEEAAIEIIRFRNFTTSFTDSVIYAALIVHKEIKSYPEMVVMLDGNAMEHKYIKYYRNSMKFNIDDKISYGVYWQRIQDALPITKTRLFISPEGVYNQLNLETLKSSDGKYQLQKSQFVQVANTKDVLVQYYEKQQKVKDSDKNNTSKFSNIVIVGNPTYYPVSLPEDYDKTIPQLPGSEREAKGINALLKSKGIPSDLYVEGAATEEKIKSLKSPRFFHIATHGYFLPDMKQSGFDSELENEASQNPLYRSGLLMVNGGELINDPSNVDFNSQDGLLTAYEAMNLDFDNTELVLLSACETGLGDVQLGEGVFGLQRAFIVAGSKNVIMSLFKVSDEVTADLLNQFYTNWLNTGNKRQALYDAKIYILNKYKEPIYWGAFVLVGLD